MSYLKQCKMLYFLIILIIQRNNDIIKFVCVYAFSLLCQYTFTLSINSVCIISISKMYTTYLYCIERQMLYLSVPKKEG